jgi:hypothetical protein
VAERWDEVGTSEYSDELSNQSENVIPWHNYFITKLYKFHICYGLRVSFSLDHFKVLLVEC